MQTADTLPPPKTVPDLLATAREATGLSDFGDMQFLAGLENVVAGFNNEAQLTAIGEQMAFGGLLNFLINRLRYIRDIKDHPEILEEDIVKPIIILGLPRTGTTKLQRILSADPQSQPMTYWRMMNPAPLPGEEPGNPKERIEVAEAVVQMLAENFPNFMARHPTEAQQPDEEVLLMQGAFQCAVTWLFARMPSFYDFVMEVDQLPTYQYLHSQMQYLQWQDGGGRGRSWILKSPCHTGYLDTLLQVFPDAVLVNCHRDVGKVIPSISALVEEMRRIHSDPVDRSVIGPEMLDYFGRLMDRHLQQRAKLPPGRVLDFRYEDIVNDVIGVVQQIYSTIGRTLTQEAIDAITAHEQERPQHQFGSYTYSAADFGLTQEMIDKRFTTYQQSYADYLRD
ncbi:MAG: sulfotransferase [Pseudomonadales bacterium]|nr:sulfotransferase [Pseudomonadales bacterium]